MAAWIFGGILTEKWIFCRFLLIACWLPTVSQRITSAIRSPPEMQIKEMRMGHRAFFDTSAFRELLYFPKIKRFFSYLFLQVCAILR